MIEKIKAHFIPLVRYASVGFFVTLFNFGMLAVFVEYFNFNATFSSGLAYVLSAKMNYLLQYYLTFRSERRHHLALIRYWAVTVFTATINVGLFWVMNVPLGIYYLYAQFIAISLVFLLNFLLHHHFTFGPEPKMPDSKQS